jgi:hypothetical protein
MTTTITISVIDPSGSTVKYRVENVAGDMTDALKFASEVYDADRDGRIDDDGNTRRVNLTLGRPEPRGWTYC